MTDQPLPTVESLPWDDGTTAPFWAAAREHRLVLQQCLGCGHCQLYPRPFCLSCEGRELGWVEAAGEGVVYSRTDVHLEVLAELPPPFTILLVDLDEGPRLLLNARGDAPAIGERVQVVWREREGLPPFPECRRTG